MNIGRLTRVDLRELWRHEARDFTAWLSENLDLLGETLGLQLPLRRHSAAPSNGRGSTTDAQAGSGMSLPQVVSRIATDGHSFRMR